MGSSCFWGTCPRCKNKRAYFELHHSSERRWSWCDTCGRYGEVDPFWEAAYVSGGFGVFEINGIDGGTPKAFLKRKPLSARMFGLMKSVTNPKVKSVRITVKVRGQWKMLVLKSDARPRARIRSARS